MREVFAQDGYLFLRGYLDVDEVMEARRECCARLQQAGVLHPDRDPMEGIVNPQRQQNFSPDIARDNPAVEQVLYGERMITFFEHLLGGDILHFDFTWLRTVGPGKGTPPHCDVVYMGRGTRRLYTTWVPYGATSLEVGGLMILEDSHKKADRIRKYLESDVDSYCEGSKLAEKIQAGENKWSHRGWLTHNPVSLREKLGGRWLTAEYQPGDMLIFGMETIHASLDNQTPDRLRLSSDSRYQLASEPADERWIGPNPVGHSLAGKRGRIC